MVKRISTYKIKEFPEDDRIWRLAWLGKLNINPNVLTEPTIDAILVPFKSNIIDNQVDVTSNASYDYTKIRVICIGTGLFPILRLGSFWVNGVEVPGNSTYKEKIVSNLVISSKTSIISDFNINKGQQDAQTGLNIFSHYPEVSRFPLSKILVIDWHEKNNPDPNTKLLIPCTEIFRFYYGRSSQLARILLHGGLETESNRIYDPVLSKCFNGMGYLKLRQSIPDLNADVVARLAFSEYANKQATNIYHNLLKHKENTNNFILEVRPPFEAEINLSVLGKWVKSFGTWHFLAIRLITCSSPFPFQHLTFDRDNDGRTVENNEDKPVAWTTSHRHFVKKKLLKKNDNIVTNEAEPWVNLELTELNIDEVDCFTSLQGIIIEKSTKTENQSQSSKTTTFIPHESGNEYSTGEGSNSRSLFEPLAVIVQSKHIGKQTGKVHQKQHKKILPGGIDTYADILDKLAILFDIKCNPIQLNFDNEFPPIEFCSYFPLSLDGSLWPYLDYNSKIRRQVMICEVIYHNCYFYFCDIQIDENNKNDRYVMFSIHAENFTKLSEEKLKEIIFLCSKNHGRWLNSNEMLELVSYKFKHNMKDSENYAKRYFNYIHTSIMESNLNLQTPLQNTISSHDNIELNLNDSTDTNKTA